MLPHTLPLSANRVIPDAKPHEHLFFGSASTSSAGPRPPRKSSPPASSPPPRLPTFNLPSPSFLKDSEFPSYEEIEKEFGDFGLHPPKILTMSLDQIIDKDVDEELNDFYEFGG